MSEKSLEQNVNELSKKYDSKKLFDLYNKDPKLKAKINALPQDQWLPELQKEYDKRRGKGNSLTKIIKYAVAGGAAATAAYVGAPFIYPYLSYII